MNAFVSVLYRALHHLHLHEVLPTTVLQRIRVNSCVYSIPTKKNGEGTPSTRQYGIPRRVVISTTRSSSALS